jgi:NADPH:quinone reductase-like Zn-dependent oxidoreductase
VIGTASAANHDFLRGLGAEIVIDYRTERFEEIARDVDVVLDSVGGDTLERSFKAVKAGGAVVSIVGDPSSRAPAGKAVRAAGILVRPDAAQLAGIAALVDEGKLRPEVSLVLPLAEARRAHEASQGGHTRGKIVLKVAD